MEPWHYCVTRQADVRCRPEEEGRFLLYNPRSDELHLIGPRELLLATMQAGGIPRWVSPLTGAAA